MRSNISYQIRSKITQIDPNLDMLWQEKLIEIFKPLSEETQQLICEQLLLPKKIFWNAKDQSFTAKSHVTVGHLAQSLTTNQMSTLASKIAHSLNELKTYTDVIKIANYLESIQNQISQVETQDSQQLLREKRNLLTSFLYDAANIIKILNLEVPENCRHLTQDEIRTYILEVYIKQQLLGYWFKTVLPRQLKQEEHPVYHKFIVPEQKIREFEMVDTTRYLFIIAPTRDFQQNPYSIRRFLLEETVAQNSHIYLNGAVLDKEQLSNQQYLEEFVWQISRIVTIQRQISAPILELMDKFHDYSFDVLMPLLTKPLDASGYSVEQMIHDRIGTLEKELVTEVLQPFQDALLNLVRHPDEFEYTFLSMHRFFSDLVIVYNDFSSETIVSFNTQAQIVGYKLLSYLKLLEKRRASIFLTLDAEALRISQTKSEQPIQDVKRVLTEALGRNKALNSKLTQKKRDLAAQKPRSFLLKFLDKSDKIKAEINDLDLELNNNRRLAYLDLVKVPKVHEQLTVYLEFETFVSIEMDKRHYAFTNGENGVSLLPIIIELPEEKETVNLQQISATLNADLNKFFQPKKKVA